MFAQLEPKGVDVKVDSETYRNSRFAPIRDPDDNPVELWKPSRKQCPESGVPESNRLTFIPLANPPCLVP